MKFRITIYLLLLWPAAALADISPSRYDGLSIVPADNTEISMREETVNIFVRNKGAKIPSRYLCDVDAEFIMENDSGHRIDIMVGFPVQQYWGNLDLFGLNGSIKDDIYNFRVVANGVPVDSVTASVVNGSFMASRPHDYIWFGWHQVFNPGTTRIQASYSFVTTPVVGLNATSLGYSLYSGSFWKGPIGEAIVVVNFPRKINKEFISLINSPAYTLESEKVVWDFVDFEPTRNDNIRLEFRPFELIDDIETARKAFESRRDDPDAKIALAEAYLNTLRNSRKRPRLGSNIWNGIYYAKEAEKLILEALDENPCECHVWNLYLSHYFKMHENAWSPVSLRPELELSTVQSELINQAFKCCPTDTGIGLWKALLEQNGPDCRDAVQRIEEVSDRITVWLKGSQGHGHGVSIQPPERDILYLMYQPVDTVKSETYISSRVKAEKREITLKLCDEPVPDDLRKSIREIVGWDGYLRSLNGKKIREYNKAAGIY